MVQSRGGLALVLTGASLLSAAWLAACWIFLRDDIGLENLRYLQPLELATGLVALLVPLLIVWMAALFIGRAGALRRETRSLLERLDGLTYPDQAATERVAEITRALKAQTELLAAATEASVSRVETLRQSLAEEARGLAALGEASGSQAEDSQARLAALMAHAARQQQQATAAVAAAEPGLRAGGASLERVVAELQTLSRQALADLQQGLGELQAAAERLAGSSQESAGRLQEGAEGLLGLGRRLGESAQVEAARLAENALKAEQRLSGFVAGLGRLDGAVVELLQRLDLDLAARGERLKALVAGELQTLSGAAESLRRSAEAAGQGLAEQATALSRRLQEELGARAAALTGALEPQMRQLAEVTAQAAGAARALGEGLAGERRALGEAAGEAQTRVAALGETLVARQRDLVAAAAAAEAAAAGVARALQGETGRLTATAQDVTQALGGESAALALRIGQLRAEAETALAKVGALQKQSQGEARDAFLALASQLVEELNRQTLDLHALLGEELPDEVWQRLKAGDRSIVARRLPRLKDRQGALAIVRRYERDSQFKALADRYMAGFERLLAEAGAADPGHGLSALFLTADVGRLYLLLARATGRSQPGAERASG